MHQSVLFRLHNFTFANSSRNISSDISISIHFLCNLSVRFHGQSTAGHSNRGLKRPTFLAMSADNRNRSLAYLVQPNLFYKSPMEMQQTLMTVH